MTDDIKEDTPPPEPPPPKKPALREVRPESERRGGRESLPQDDEDGRD